MKKFLTLFLSLVVMLFTGQTVFAEGSINVQNPGEYTYRAYKIFDAEKDASDKFTYSIAEDSLWLDAVYDKTNEESLVPGLEFTKDSAKYIVKKMNSFSAADFGAYLKDHIPAEAAFTDFAGATAEHLADGYYMVLASNADPFDPADVQTKVSLTTVKDGETVKIQNKNDMPFDKYVAEDGEWVKQRSMELGETLNFKILGKVPSLESTETVYVYYIFDILDEGLTFDKDTFKVKINGADVTSLTVVEDAGAILTGDQVRFGKNGKIFELSLDMLTRGKNADLQGKDVEVTYSAVVNADAAAVVTENNAVLQPGNDPTNLESKDSTTKQYTSKIVIDKFEAGNPEQKLAGAKFVLLNAEDKFYKFDSAAGKVSWVAEAADASEYETDNTGKAEFIGLLDGEYKLRETAAPSGYSKLTADIPVSIDGSNATAVGLTADQISLALQRTMNVSNTPGTILPGTGGIGSMIVYVAAGIGMIAAFAYVALQRREEQE